MGRGGRGEGGSQAGQRWERWVGGGGEPVAALEKSHTAKPQKAASRAERKQGARPPNFSASNKRIEQQHVRAPPGDSLAAAAGDATCARHHASCYRRNQPPRTHHQPQERKKPSRLSAAVAENHLAATLG